MSDMSNAGVFHPGHDEWHGQTVVVDTNAARTFIGRWDADTGAAIRMFDVAVHDSAAAEESRDEWVARIKKFGIPVDEPTTLVPKGEVTTVIRLRDA
jgi:hypothetical protein